jgi:polyphosphate kinase 2 (PPK2 family)
MERRITEINEFERMLAEDGTVFLKFYLHISKDEQLYRFAARGGSLQALEDQRRGSGGIAGAGMSTTRCGGDVRTDLNEWAPWHICAGELQMAARSKW